MSTEKKSSSKKMIQWGFVILIIVLIILIIGITFNVVDFKKTNPSSSLTEYKDQLIEELSLDNTLSIAEDDSGDHFLAEKNYTVQKGDNLWRIAGKDQVLANSFEWTTILIQNRNKIDYMVFNENKNQWNVYIAEGRKLKIRPEELSSAQANLQGKKHYAIQLMSVQLSKLNEAINIVQMLLKDGYYAYLYRTKDKIKTQSGKSKQYFYRIRIGFYPTEKEAKQVGEEIYEKYEDQEIFPENFWPVIPSYSELSGELLDFGIQRTKPWIVEFEEVESLQEAKQQLRKINSMVDFSYISEKREDEDEEAIYRTRIGFFETEEIANKKLNEIEKKYPNEFEDANVREVKNLQEADPGQSKRTLSKRKIQEKY